MKKEIRTVVYDEDLQIEAYRLQGIVQTFPNHFHEYYVIGFIEDGERFLSCKHKDYVIGKGSIVLFNPGDNHTCVQRDDGTLYYRGINITKEKMLELSKEISGRENLPGFSKNVIEDEEIVSYLKPLHEMMMSGSPEFSKEENLLLLISHILKNYSQPFEDCIPECREEIGKACTFIEQHFTERICLEQICQHANLSKSTLLRSFTKSKGVTPYRYLETLRISEAKKLLENGATPIEAALQTGFSDQSHFTNYFNSFLGLSPGMYREIFYTKNRTDGTNHEE